MTPQNPFEKLLDEMNNILKMLEANKNSRLLDDEHMSPEVLARMQKLERDLKKFESMGEKVVDLNQQLPDLAKGLMPENKEETLPPEAKRIIARAKELKAKAKTLEKEIIHGEKGALQQEHAPPAPLTEKELKKGSGHKRKSKFRHFGDGHV